MKDIQYWLTVHWPGESNERPEGIFIRRHHKRPRGEAQKAARRLQETMKTHDLVFVYQTKTDPENRRRHGAGKIMALLKVKEDSNLIEGKGRWIQVKKTSYKADVDCPVKLARQITDLPLGYPPLFGDPVPRTNVQKLNNSQAVRLLSYVCNAREREMLLTTCLPEKAGDEDGDEEYQEHARLAEPDDRQEGPRKPQFVDTRKGRQVKKDPRIAKIRFLMSEYKCEVDPTHQTFTSRSTKKNFVEAHHLVPVRMDLQEKFGHIGLDHENNIVSLCPNCHRRLHHAISDEKEDTLRHLYRMRKKDLEKAGIHIKMARLISYYK